MGGVWQQGTQTMKDDVMGGCCSLLHEGWMLRNGREVVDSRGWGRWSGVTVIGKGGSTMVLMSVYWPVKGQQEEDGGSMWARQQQAMTALGLRQGNKVDPRLQLIEDLREELVHLTSQGASIVLVGDLNLPVMRDACGDPQRRHEHGRCNEVIKRRTLS